MSKIMRNVSYFHVIKELIKTDLTIFKTLAADKLINLFIWVSTMALVFAYVMPAFGLTQSYGVFILATMCSSVGLFQSFGFIAEMVADFEGDRIINYDFMLPIPSWLIFIRFIIYYAITFMMLGFFVLPAGKLMLWNSLSLTGVHYGKYFLIFVLTNIFYGVFGLWLVSYVRNLALIENVWMRFLYPLWFLGCFQFSWEALHGASTTLAYIDLLNPITYISEGTRAAILGQEGSLNFWVCVGVLLVFIVLCGVHAIARLKKRLDFV